MDLIATKKADDLKAFYLANEYETTEHFFTTTSTNNIAYRKKMDAFIRTSIQNEIDDLFKNYTNLYSSFIVKKRGFKGKIGLHADWQFVEEPQFSAINIWIALSDLNKNSATLKVVPASYKLVNQMRGPNYVLDKSLYSYQDKLKTIPLKKGQAIIYDTRLLHASSNNLLHKKRIVASALVVPEEAPILYNYFNANDTTKFSSNVVDKNFYLEKCNFKAVNGVWEKAETN